MKRLTLLTALSVTVILSGCGGVSDSLGFGRNPPDEFAVVDRPPLSLPPDYTLRPPKPGAPRPQEINMTQRAGTVLFGENAKASEGDSSKSVTENSLLEAIGAAKSEPNIRETIDREASQKVVGTRHLVDELLWWKDSASDATTVDAAAEKERLDAAKEQGASVNQGATPVIERQKRKFLGL